VNVPSRISRAPDPGRLAAVALTFAEGVGPVTRRQMVGAHGTIRRAVEALAPDVAMRAIDRAERAASEATRIGASCVIPDDGAFPVSFNELEDPPLAIWTLGDVVEAAASPAIAVVGTRDSTPYGERVTRSIVAGLARAGVSIVSGMARGIDAMAHRAALDAGGRTVAVLGTGVDVPYPVGHRELHGAIARAGAIISEGPPGARAHAGCFPRRNRLIAALGGATIVVEAGVKSGAMGTVEHALALGRTVGVVPGPVDSAQSEGTNLLIRDGATPITSVADALALLGLSAPGPASVQLDDAVQRKVWDALAKPARTLDVLCMSVGLPARECMTAISALEVRGAIECGMTGEIRRRS